MKPVLIFSLLAASAYFYFNNPAAPTPVVTKAATVEARPAPAAPQALLIVPAPSSYHRWRTGPTAQNDWKTGPNAQTEFEPFAPNEHANWNRSSGYTIVSGATIRR